MRQSTRLILNTLATYLRMAVTVGIGLTQTRWLKAAVGHDEIGLLNVLGASGALLLFLTDSLAVSSERHLAHAIGKNDKVELARVFNTMLVLFLFVGLFIGAVGTGVAPVIDRLLEIPPGREHAAKWVFFYSVLAMLMSVLTTPFRGMFIAAQEIVYVTVFELVRSVYQLLAVVMLSFVPGDDLIFYSALLALGNGIILAWLVCVCLYRYPESRPRPSLFSRTFLVEVKNYIFWSMIGSASWRLVVQGNAILLNRYFLPAANAAFTYASQVSGYQSTLTSAIARAAEPAAVTVGARGDQANLHRLTIVVSKYQSLMALFFFVPVQLELDFLLHAWLRDIPADTVMMTRMVLTWMWVMGWTQGYLSAMAAHGKLAGFGVLVVIQNVVTFAVMWLVCALGAPPWAPPAVAAAIEALSSPLRTYYVGRKINLPNRLYFTGVLAPLLLVMVTASLPAAAMHLLAPQGWVRFFAVAGVYAVAAVPAIWWMGIDATERSHFTRVLRAGASKIGLGPKAVSEASQQGG